MKDIKDENIYDDSAAKRPRKPKNFDVTDSTSHRPRKDSENFDVTDSTSHRPRKDSGMDSTEEELMLFYGIQTPRETNINNSVPPNGEARVEENHTTDNQVNNPASKSPNFPVWEIIRALFNTKYFFKRYSILTFITNILSIIFYTSDFVLDWVNAFEAYWFRIDENGSDFIFFFWLTVASIAIPSIVITILSIMFEQEDNWASKKGTNDCNEFENNLFDNSARPDEDNSSESTRNSCSHGWCYYPWYILSHFLQFSPVFRYFRTILFGFKSRYMEVRKNESEWKRYDQEYKNQLSDATFVRLIESLLEAGPQVMLQIYLMIRTFNEISPFTIISVVISGLSMTLSFVGYQRALRDSLRDSDGKEQLSVPASIVLGVYITCFNISRLIALALVLNTNFWVWLIGLLLHWIFMFVFIFIKKTAFFDPESPCFKSKELFYQFIMGLCYVFSYVNVHQDDKKNLLRMLIYYSIMFIENTFAVTFWYWFRNDNTLLSEIHGNPSSNENFISFPRPSILTVILTVLLSFLFGVFFMAIYYVFLHPSTSIKLRNIEVNIRIDMEQLPKVKRSALRNLYRPSIASNRLVTVQNLNRHNIS